jgi:hypothetical protein
VTRTDSIRVDDASVLVLTGDPKLESEGRDQQLEKAVEVLLVQLDSAP